MKDIVLGALSVIALAFSLVAVNQPAPVVNTDEPVGAAAGTEHMFPEKFYAPVVLGGNVFATSSIGAATYTASSLQNTSLIQHTAASALTVTLPASSTLRNFLPKSGDTRTIFLHAITSNITVAGGTGTELDNASSSARVIAGGMARLDFVRKANNDIEVLFTTGI